MEEGWREGAPERVIESRARSLLYRPPYAAPFRALPSRCLPDQPPPRAQDQRKPTLPHRVLAHSASFSLLCCPPSDSLSVVLLLARSLAHLRAQNAVLGRKRTDYMYWRRLLEGRRRQQRGRRGRDRLHRVPGTSRVCVSVPKIDGNELPALRTYSCGISISRISKRI